MLILSADARPGLIQRLLEQGARSFLTKPLAVKELLEILDAVAAGREQAPAGYGRARSSLMARPGRTASRRRPPGSAGPRRRP